MLNEKIKFERKRLKLTQNDLSKLLNVSQPTLAGYETGVREPDLETLLKLAKIFNCSVDYLLDNEKAKIYFTDDWQREIIELTQNASDIEKAKIKAYIQGLLDSKNR